MSTLVGVIVIASIGAVVGYLWGHQVGWYQGYDTRDTEPTALSASMGEGLQRMLNDRDLLAELTADELELILDLINRAVQRKLLRGE